MESRRRASDQTRRLERRKARRTRCGGDPVLGGHVGGRGVWVPRIVKCGPVSGARLEWWRCSSWRRRVWSEARVGEQLQWPTTPGTCSGAVKPYNRKSLRRADVLGVDCALLLLQLVWVWAWSGTLTRGRLPDYVTACGEEGAMARYDGTRLVPGEAACEFGFGRVNCGPCRQVLCAPYTVTVPDRNHRISCHDIKMPPPPSPPVSRAPFSPLRATPLIVHSRCYLPPFLHPTYLHHIHLPPTSIER